MISARILRTLLLKELPGLGILHIIIMYLNKIEKEVQLPYVRHARLLVGRLVGRLVG